MNSKILVIILLLATFSIGVVAQDVTPEVTIEATMEATAEASMENAAEASGVPDQIVIRYEGLFPEGVDYDTVNDRFLVSSIAEGTVHAVADDGSLTPLVQDDRIPSSTGIEVDEAGNRLLVAITNLESEAMLGIYDLTSGENIALVDFAPLLPTDPEHFANDVAVDSQGNPSIFLEDETFSTQFALNGIAYNEAGNYLLVVRVPGLIKIPLDNPGGFTEVALDTPIPGEDGIVFVDERTLAVVSNDLGRVYRIESNDDFTTARATDVFETGQVNPTTVAVREGAVYVLYAYLNAAEDLIAEFPIQHVTFDAIQSMPELTAEATEAS